MKVCQAHARDFYRQKNIKSAPAQRRHYVEKRRVRYAALRAEGIAAYGGKCACCGETTFEFLTIDHVRNDGKAHRRALGGDGYAVYAWLAARGWPSDGFRVLCMNCNWARRHTGICPHERRLRVVK